MKFTVQPKEPVKMQDLHYGDFAIISDPQVIDAYKKKLVTMVQDGEGNSMVIFLEHGASENIETLIDVEVTLIGKGSEIIIEV